MKMAVSTSKPVVKEFDKEEEECEEKEQKTREWDDWKDANPRGSGNKMRNVG